MSSAIVSQDGVEVKQECNVDWCHEAQFRNSGLCFTHFIEEETAEWDAQDTERQTCLEGVGYAFNALAPTLGEVYR